MRFYSQLVRKQSQKNGGNQSQQEDEWRKYRTKVSEFTFFAQGNQLSAHVTVKLDNMGQTVFTHLQDEDGQSRHSNKQEEEFCLGCSLNLDQTRNRSWTGQGAQTHLMVP